jgi:hypothetical protein
MLPLIKERVMRRQSRTTLRSVLVTVAALVAFTSANVAAQDVATGSATATLVIALTVTATQALQFGNVYQGVAKSVAKNTADAGEFLIVGEPDANIAIYMQLPDYLSTDAVSGNGDDRMVIGFSTTDCNVDTTAGGDPTGWAATDGWADQDPHNITNAATVGSGGTNVYLGGGVTPSVDQKAGAYEADIILTVAYTGV